MGWSYFKKWGIIEIRPAEHRNRLFMYDAYMKLSGQQALRLGRTPDAQEPEKTTQSEPPPMNAALVDLLLERMLLARRVVFWAAAILAGLLFLDSISSSPACWRVYGEPLWLMPPLFLLLIILCGGAMATCYYVFRAGLHGMGLGYAVGHLLLCLAFSFVLLVGIIVVPLLVRCDIARRRKMEAGSPEGGDIDPWPMVPLRLQYRLRNILLAVAALGVYYGLYCMFVVRLENSPYSGRVRLTDLVTIEVPPGTRHKICQGIDTQCGELILPDRRTIIEYDIGFWAGYYVTGDSAGKGQSRLASDKAGAVPFGSAPAISSSAVRMDYRLDRRDGANILYVTFPQLGPANFSCKIEDQSRLDEILNLIRTVE